MAKLINVECPNGHVVSVSVRDVGKKLRCPICDVLMRVPASAVPVMVAPLAVAAITPMEGDEPTLEVVDAEPPVEAPVSQVEQVETKLSMRRVRMALNVSIARLYVMVICFLGLVGWWIILFRNRPKGVGAIHIKMPVAMSQFILACGILLFIMEISALVCALSTPKKTGGRPLLLIYIGAQILLLVLSFVVMLVLFSLSIPIFSIWMVLVSVAFVSFILYLKKIAAFQQQTKIVKKVNGLFWLTGFCVVGTFMLFLPSAIEMPQQIGRNNAPSDLSVAISLMGVLIMLVAGIWSILRYVRLLIGIRDSLKVYG